MRPVLTTGYRLFSQRKWNNFFRPCFPAASVDLKRRRKKSLLHSVDEFFGPKCLEIVNNAKLLVSVTKVVGWPHRIRRATRFPVRLFTSFALLVSLFATVATGQTNILENNGFETNTAGVYGNNVVSGIATPWWGIMSLTEYAGGLPYNSANVVKVDGDGPNSYGDSGPGFDAEVPAALAQTRHYIDIANDGGYAFQIFDFPACTNGSNASAVQVGFEGYFSTRDNGYLWDPNLWNPVTGTFGDIYLTPDAERFGSISIREIPTNGDHVVVGPIAPGPVAPGSYADVIVPEPGSLSLTSGTAPWTYLTGTGTLVPGTLYTYVAMISDILNFDAAGIIVPAYCPLLTIAKTTGAQSAVAADGTFTQDFSIVVTNSGNSTITDLTLVDDLEAVFGNMFDPSVATVTTSGIVSGPVITVNNGTPTVVANASYDGDSAGDPSLIQAGGSMAAGDQITVTFTALFDAKPRPMGGTLVNSATVSGDVPGVVWSPDATSTSNVVVPSFPKLTIEKTYSFSSDPNGNSLADAGDVILYTYEVTNTGNVPIDDITVTDAHTIGTTTGTDTINPAVICNTLTDNLPTGDSTFVSGTNAITTLAPADKVTCTFSYLVTQDDVDWLQ